MREQLVIQTDRVYTIQRSPQGVVCTVNGGTASSSPLPLRLDLWNHSPTGFEFGYGGSGTAQLAPAILAHCFGGELAGKNYQTFKGGGIGRNHGPGGSVTGTFVGDMLAKLQADRAAQNCHNN